MKTYRIISEPTYSDGAPLSTDGYVIGAYVHIVDDNLSPDSEGDVHVYLVGTSESEWMYLNAKHLKDVSEDANSDRAALIREAREILGDYASAEYRALAVAAMRDADEVPHVADPFRIDLHRQATVYALLALGTDASPEVPPVTVESLDRALAQSAAGDVESLGSFAEHAEPEKPKPTPRKRAARKTTTTTTTTTTKETSK